MALEGLKISPGLDFPSCFQTLCFLHFSHPGPPVPTVLWVRGACSTIVSHLASPEPSLALGKQAESQNSRVESSCFFPRCQSGDCGHWCLLLDFFSIVQLTGLVDLWLRDDIHYLSAITDSFYQVESTIFVNTKKLLNLDGNLNDIKRHLLYITYSFNTFSVPALEQPGTQNLKVYREFPQTFKHLLVGNPTNSLNSYSWIWSPWESQGSILVSPQ